MIEINVKGNAKQYFIDLEKTSLKADMAIDKITTALRGLPSSKTVSLDIKSNGINSIKEMASQLKELSNKKVNLDLNVKGTKKLDRTLDKLDNIKGHKVDIEVNAPQSLDNLSNKMRELNTQTRNTRRHFSILGKTLTAFEGFRLISQQIKDTLKDFSELEQGIAGIKKTTNLAGSDLRELTDELTRLSITQNAMDITALQKIAESAGQLGISGKDNIIEFTKVIRELSATSSLTAEQAGTEFAKLSLTLHEPIKEVKRLASTFTLLASTTTTDEKKLVNYTQRLAGMGKTFGLTTQEIVGMSATLADIGVSARLGTTAVSRLMTKMLTHTQLVTDVLRLDFDKFAYAIEHKPIQAINMFLERLGRLDKQNVAQALREMKLSSVGAVQTLIKLSHATGKLNTNIATSIKAYRENIALDREFKTVQDTLKGATEKYTSSVKNMNYQLGKLFKPIVIEAQNLLAGLANAIAKTAKNIDWLINGEKYAKEYMSKTNVEIRRQSKALKDLTNSQTKEKNIKSAIIKLSKEYNSILNKNSRQAKALERALASLGKEYNKTILKVKQLQRTASKTITQRVKVKVDKIPKYEIKHRLPQVEVVNNLVSNLTDISSSFSPNDNKKLEDYKRLEIAKVKTFKKYENDRLAIEREANRRALRDLANYHIKMYNRQNSILAKIRKRNKKHLAQLAEDFKTANREINDYLLKESKGEFALQKELLKREYNEYKKLGINKIKLEKWYQTKLKHILDDEAKNAIEIAKERDRKLAKEMEERVKRELESIDKQLDEYHRKGIGTLDIKATLKNIWDKAGFQQDLEVIFKNVGEDFSKNLANSLASNKVTQGLKNNLLNIVNTLAYGNTSNDSKNEKYGKAIGGSAGAIAGYAFGGSIGAKIGETLGVILGGSIGRGWKKYIEGEKSQWVKFNDETLKDFTRTSAHLFSSTKYKTNISLTKQLQIRFKEIVDSYNLLYTSLDIATKNFYHAMTTKGSFRTKDLQENLDKEFIKGLSPNISKEDLQGVYDAWKQYTKDTKQSVSQAIIEELSRVTQIKQDIALYLANKNKDIVEVYRLKTMQDLSVISTIGKELNTTDIKDYNAKLQLAIKQGKVLTKEDIGKWDTLGKALLDYNQQRDAYKKSLIDERNRIKDLIKARSTSNKGLATTSKKLLELYDYTSGIVANKNKTPNLANAPIDRNLDINQLKGIFESYSDNNDKSFMGVIDTAIARNRINRAGYSIENAKLSYGESKQLESLDKLEKRLASIEKLLEQQGEILTSTEKNTYISANKV